MRKKLISVIIPVYNVNTSDFQQCLKSVISQKYSNLEIIIVDDGSKKEVANFCDEIAKIDERIVVFHTKNQGVSSARNYGFQKSKGEYIMFIDSDDILLDSMIYLLYKNIIETDLSISACGYSFIELDGKEYQRFDTKKIFHFNKEEAMISFFSDDTFGVSVWNKMFKRELINDIKFNEKLKINEDRLFLFQSIIKANGLIYEDKCLYKYIKRENSATTCQFSQSRFDVLKVNQMIYDQIKDTFKNNQQIEDYCKVNEIIYLIRLYRELILSNQKKNYIKENTFIISRLKELSKSNILSSLNKFDRLETKIIINFNFLYYPMMKFMTKIKFIKKLKNILQKKGK